MSSPRLDHIIILLPYASVVSLPKYFTDNFTITPGGRHADNKTENKLICFQDGSYLELVAFINDDPANREGHWWGEKKFGVIDFAFTHADGEASVHFSELENRLQGLNLGGGTETVSYQPPVAGGRKRPDGVDVKWEVTFPVVGKGFQRGELPFWCHDVTPREVRAPFTKENITHPCGSNGVSELCVFVSEERVPVLLKAYAAILASSVDGGSAITPKLRHVEGSNTSTRISVVSPKEEWQKNAMAERGGYLLGSLNVASKQTGSRIDDADGGFGIGGLLI